MNLKFTHQNVEFLRSNSCPIEIEFKVIEFKKDPEMNINIYHG